MVHGIRPDELVRLTCGSSPFPPPGPNLAGDRRRRRLTAARPRRLEIPLGQRLSRHGPANWRLWRSRSSRPRRWSISGPRPAAISTAWSPKRRSANCTLNARCGPRGGPRSRGTERACRHDAPFSASRQGLDVRAPVAIRAGSRRDAPGSAAHQTGQRCPCLRRQFRPRWCSHYDPGGIAAEQVELLRGARQMGLPA